MHPAKHEASSRPQSVARWGWILAGVCAVVSAGWFSLRARAPDRPMHALREDDAPASVEELQKLKAKLGQLERTSSALKLALATREQQAPAAEDRAAPLPARADEATADPRTEMEKHRELLRGLDAKLVTDAGDPVEQSATAEVFRDQLTSATQGRAEVVELKCASDFCKAILEEESSAEPALNMTDVVDATPFLRREAMFDYATEGAFRRTFIYAALEGHLLPFERGAFPLPSAE